MLWNRDGQKQELFEKLRVHTGSFAKVYVSYLPFIQLAFFDRTTRSEAQKMLRDSRVDSLGYVTVDEFLGYRNMRVSCPAMGKKGVLLVCRGDKIPYHTRVVDVVRFGDGVPAYVFVEFFDATDSRVGTDKGARVQLMETRKDSEIDLPNDYSMDWKAE